MHPATSWLLSTPKNKGCRQKPTAKCCLFLFYQWSAVPSSRQRRTDAVEIRHESINCRKWKNKSPSSSSLVHAKKRRQTSHVFPCDIRPRHVSLLKMVPIPSCAGFKMAAPAVRVCRRCIRSQARKSRVGRPRPHIDRIIRVDHAGELGADRIYAGQMAVLGRTSTGPTIQVRNSLNG